MKNLFLTLAFATATSFSFAGINSSNKEVAKASCFDFTLSCGVSGTACGNDTGALIDLILFADDLIC